MVEIPGCPIPPWPPSPPPRQWKANAPLGEAELGVAAMFDTVGQMGIRNQCPLWGGGLGPQFPHP